MIDNFKLTEDLVQFKDGFDSWEQAIIDCAKPLVDGEFINDNYVVAMIESVKEYGPYIVIAPNIAMPHARPEAGSKKVGFSVTVSKKAVSFGTSPEHDARLLVTLSCVSADTHLLMLQALVGVLADEEKFEAILNATKKEENLALFN